MLKPMTKRRRVMIWSLAICVVAAVVMLGVVGARREPPYQFMKKYPVLKVWTHGNRTGYLLKGDLDSVMNAASLEFHLPSFSRRIETGDPFTKGFREYIWLIPDIRFTDNIEAVDDHAQPPSGYDVPRVGHHVDGYSIVLGEPPKPSLLDKAMDWVHGVFGQHNNELTDEERRILKGR